MTDIYDDLDNLDDLDKVWCQEDAPRWGSARPA
jgi:hypothetical protein